MIYELPDYADFETSDERLYNHIISDQRCPFKITSENCATDNVFGGDIFYIRELPTHELIEYLEFEIHPRFSSSYLIQTNGNPLVLRTGDETIENPQEIRQIIEQKS